VTSTPTWVAGGVAEPGYGAPFDAPPSPPSGGAVPPPPAPSVPPARPASPEVSQPPTPVPVLVTRIALIIGLVGAWCVLFVAGLSGVPAARAQQVGYGDLRSGLAQEIVPIGGAIKPGTPVALIEAPAIDLRYVVVEGTSSGDLRAGPGHLRSTPLPGQAGVSVIFGRAFAYGGPFRHVTLLQPGDTVTVTTQQGTFTYRVDGVRRAGDPVPDPPAAGAARMTLVTAEGVSWRSGWVPDRAVYVDTTLTGATVPTPAGRPGAVPIAENAMQGDKAALFPLVLWLQLLLLAGLGVVWAQSRWGGAQAWLVGTPVVLAALFGAGQTAIQLLPNLL
jgi:sortase A